MSNENSVLRPDEIDNYVDFFLENNSSLISKLSYKIYDTNSTSVLKGFKETIRGTLNSAYNKFIEKNNHSTEYLDKYLFGAIHWKVKSINNKLKTAKVICPGCLYLKNIEILTVVSDGLSCNNCTNLYQNSQIGWEKKLASIFMLHSSTGHQCLSCKRFIPQNKQEIISCPYPDCFFVGKITELSRMNHPRIGVAYPELLTGGAAGVSEQAPCLTEIDEEIKKYYKVVKNTILEQQKSLEYTAWSSTYLNKWCIYQAFLNLLEEDQEETISYLAKLGRHYRKSRTQIKLIQEYTNLIEKKIPFSYTRAGETFEVNSLMDPNLNLFDGISTFKSEINNEYKIPNMTEEYYVGSKSGKYCLPYYIGKLINITDIQNNKSLMSNVENYSFIDIQMNKIVKPGMEVEVKHYRLLPHYGVGTLSTLNRIKKSISDKIQIKLDHNA